MNRAAMVAISGVLVLVAILSIRSEARAQFIETIPYGPVNAIGPTPPPSAGPFLVMPSPPGTPPFILPPPGIHLSGPILMFPTPPGAAPLVMMPPALPHYGQGGQGFGELGGAPSGKYALALGVAAVGTVVAVAIIENHREAKRERRERDEDIAALIDAHRCDDAKATPLGQRDTALVDRIARECCSGRRRHLASHVAEDGCSALFEAPEVEPGVSRMKSASRFHSTVARGHCSSVELRNMLANKPLEALAYWVILFDVTEIHLSDAPFLAGKFFTGRRIALEPRADTLAFPISGPPPAHGVFR